MGSLVQNVDQCDRNLANFVTWAKKLSTLAILEGLLVFGKVFNQLWRFLMLLSILSLPYLGGQCLTNNLAI